MRDNKKTALKVKYEISRYECNHCGENATYTVDDGNFISRLCQSCYEKMIADLITNLSLKGSKAIKRNILRSCNYHIGQEISTIHKFDLGFRTITVLKQAKILNIINDLIDDLYCTLEVEYLN